MNRLCLQQLPGGYQAVLSIDLQRDTKLALLVNGLAIALAAVMLAAAFAARPSMDFFTNLPALAAFVVCCVLYMVLHELVHGACMRLLGARKVRFGFTGMYAFAGSSEYFKKGAYITVALAPVAVWGAVFLALNLAAGERYFGFIYLLQMVNVSGAAGDLYVSLCLSRLPRDILVQDLGVSMTVFSKTQP